MNQWLTWRARLYHLVFPEFECQCHVCAADRCRIKLEVIDAQKKTQRPATPAKPEGSLR